MNFDLNQFRDACSKCPEPVLYIELSARFALINMKLDVIKLETLPIGEVKEAEEKLETYRQMVKIALQAINRFGAFNDPDCMVWYAWWEDYFHSLPQDKQTSIKNDFIEGKSQDNWGRPSGSWH